MARDGMTHILLRLREMTDSGTADYTVNGSAYWTDDQLQAYADQQRQRRFDAPLQYIPQYISGTTIYQEYVAADGWVEGTAGSAFVVRDADGSAVTAYSLNATTGDVTFDSDTNGSAYYATYTAYDMERAAAEVWRQKAAHFSGRFDVATDNHDLKRSQVYQHATQMAKHYEMMAKPRSGRTWRSDVRGAKWSGY